MILKIVILILLLQTEGKCDHLGCVWSPSSGQSLYRMNVLLNHCIVNHPHYKFEILLSELQTIRRNAEAEAKHWTSVQRYFSHSPISASFPFCLLTVHLFVFYVSFWRINDGINLFSLWLFSKSESIFLLNNYFSFFFLLNFFFLFCFFVFLHVFVPRTSCSTFHNLCINSLEVGEWFFWLWATVTCKYLCSIFPLASYVTSLGVTHSRLHTSLVSPPSHW